MPTRKEEEEEEKKKAANIATTQPREKKPFLDPVRRNLISYGWKHSSVFYAGAGQVNAPPPKTHPSSCETDINLKKREREKENHNSPGSKIGLWWRRDCG